MKSRGSSGFTLIELMVVVIVLAALAGMLIPNLVDKPDKMKKEIVLADLRAIDTSLKLYRVENGEYPASIGALEAEFDNRLNDPWKNPYQYKFPGGRSKFKYDAYSMGPDGQDGSNDEIGNWEL